MKTLFFFLICTSTSVFSESYWKHSEKKASSEQTSQDLHKEKISSKNPSKDLPKKKATSEHLSSKNISKEPPELTLTLEQNIANYPYPITEGFMTEGQKEQYNERLRSYGMIRSILEVGLNAGHSAENFFQQCKDLQTFVSVDICYHPYTPYAIKYFQNKYKNRFVSLIGDSLVKIPEYANLYPHKKFDLIFIDGNHSYEYCFRDILNGRKVAHERTYLWIDDYDIGSVAAAVQTAVEMGIIEVENLHEDIEENRSWVEAHYLL